jgi:polar amino acid transport system substrate-binding protein
MGRRLFPSVLLLTLLLPLAAAACVKSVRWSEDPPFSMRLPNGRIGGVIVDLHEALLQRMGCRAQLVEMPFARALAELQLGRLDLLPSTFDRPERRSYARFSQPTLQIRNLLFVRREDLAKLRGQSLAQLVAGGWRIGAQVGVVYGPAFAELLKDPAAAAKLVTVPQRQGLWQMLERSRIDAVPADELTGPMELQTLGFSARIVASPLVLSTEGAGTAFSRLSTDEAFVQRFNATLETMKADGSYAALLARYQMRTEFAPR